ISTIAKLAHNLRHRRKSLFSSGMMMVTLKKGRLHLSVLQNLNPNTLPGTRIVNDVHGHSESRLTATV
ncbi:hypothetical protein, partial [Salmonella enterica]|uniref:hypothetical protein n=1 Tax=Salmonella enterica TaxID=28901 RepID=UPI00195A508B